MISNRCARKSLVTNCNSIISKSYLRFLVDSNGNKYKQNLLQEAIAACKNDIAKDLINRNIDLNHQDSNGQTPLHYCAQYLNIEIARLLLSKNADINIEDAYGNNPLWTAVFNARGDYRMVELFIEYNANIYHLNKSGRSSLDFAKQIDDTKLVQILSK